MADDNAIVTTGVEQQPPEVEQPQPDDDDDEGELTSTAEEFRAIFEGCEETGDRLKKLAMSLQPSAPQAAEALRQVAGEVVPLISDLIAATGGALEAMEEGGGSEGDQEGLSDEDAVDFTRTFTANLKLISEVREAAVSDEQREGLDALRSMNEEMMQRTLGLSDLDEAQMQAALAQPEVPAEGPDPEAN